MSIQSEITRISGNVSDALDAIEAKGVTIPSGSNSDDLADLIAQITGGGGAAITVTDTTDTHGGIIREISAVDISNDTVTAAHLESGYTAHDAEGNAITGTLSPGGGGGGGDISDPIRFFDYDGTLVASYKTVPSALPSVPTHSGLKNGTWNYTLPQVTTQFNAMGTCDVGANYMTESEDTELDVIMREGRLDPILTIAVNGTVTVDWGDNTTADTVTGTSLTSRKAVPHTYASAGSYTIKIHVVSGSFTFHSSTSYTILRKSTTGNENRVYANCVQAVRLGNGITSIGDSAFYNCYSLATISIPSGVTSIGGSAFGYCVSLTSISIPNGVTSIGGSAFYYCYSLASISIPSGVTSIVYQAFYNCISLASISIPSGVTSIDDSAFFYCQSLASITIPSGVTSIGNSTFGYCYSLTTISIPSGVTSIGNSAFNYCYGMAEYHVKPTTPPTLGTTPFNGIVSDCKIYVPSASLSDYQTAWSAYESYLVGE